MTSKNRGIVAQSGMRRKILIAAAMLCASATNPARADPTIRFDQHLNFGRFALKDNDSAHTIIVAPDDSATTDSEFLMWEDPQRGEYTLTELTPDTALIVTVENGSMSLGGLGGGTLFTIDDYTTNDPVTDGSGDAVLYIGGTLTTSGTGTYYPSGDYSDSIDLTIIF